MARAARLSSFSGHRFVGLFGLPPSVPTASCAEFAGSQVASLVSDPASAIKDVNAKRTKATTTAKGEGKESTVQAGEQMDLDAKVGDQMDPDAKRCKAEGGEGNLNRNPTLEQADSNSSDKNGGQNQKPPGKGKK